MPVDRARLLRPVVDDLHRGALDELRAAVADPELGIPHAADDPVRRQAVDRPGPGPHEVRAAPGEDPAREAAAVQQAEQLQHRLVHRLRVRHAEARVPRRREPAPAPGGELVGGHPGVGERHQLGQGRQAARPQLLDADRVAQLGGPVHREGQLRVQGLLCPQRAVVVEDRDPVGFRDVVVRAGAGRGGDEFRDRLLRRPVPPARQLISRHGANVTVAGGRGITRSR